MINKKILITGSEGFLGSYLVREFIENGYNVIGVDNLSKYKKRVSSNRNKFGGKYKFYCTDIKNEKIFLKLSKDCNIIIANAAYNGGIKVLNNASYDLFTENEKITLSTISSAIKNYKKTNLKRIILISTSMIYEKSKKKFSVEGDEKNFSYPESFYSFQKLSAEMLIKAANKQYNLPYNIIRPFNLFGAFDKDKFFKMSHVIPDFIKQSKTKKKYFKILGGGNQKRSFTNVAEVAKIIYKISSTNKTLNKTYNIGFKKQTKIRNLAKEIFYQINNRNIKVSKTFNKVFKNDVRFNGSLNRNIRRDLNIEPKISIEKFLKNIIQNIK